MADLVDTVPRRRFALWLSLLCGVVPPFFTAALTRIGMGPADQGQSSVLFLNSVMFGAALMAWVFAISRATAALPVPRNRCILTGLKVAAAGFAPIGVVWALCATSGNVVEQSMLWLIWAPGAGLVGAGLTGMAWSVLTAANPPAPSDRYSRSAWLATFSLLTMPLIAMLGAIFVVESIHGHIGPR